MTQTIQHGTTYGYRKGCRCDECKEAKRQDWVRYYAKKQKQIQEPEPEGPSPNLLGFEGMPSDEVYLMVDLAFHYVTHEGMGLPEATLRARSEVLNAPWNQNQDPT